MERQAKNDFMLSGYRVLELGDVGGMLCGQILADLGADVIKVEKPGGDSSRNTPPFFQDRPDPERSLFWFAYNTNKKSITLNIESAAGRRLFRKLVKSSDFLIESLRPGYLDGLGLRYSTLAKVNPRLVMTAITPFGHGGPYGNYKGSDLICMAMGGPVYLTGDADRPPVRIGFPQAYSLASLMGAAGLLIAYYHREATGKGQFVDVSAQESVMWITGNACITYEMAGVITKRGGARRGSMHARAITRLVWPCRDGAITFNMGGGGAFAKSNKALMKAMNEHGYEDEFLKAVDWEGLDMGTISQEYVDELENHIGSFFMAHDKRQLYDMALDYGLILAPVCTVKELCESPHLEVRNFWQEVEHPELGATITYPAPFLRMSPAGVPKVKRAPLIGEHNDEIYRRELGLSAKQLEVLRKNGDV